jgi:adenine-specific DNA-methyltransferase
MWQTDVLDMFSNAPYKQACGLLRSGARAGAPYDSAAERGDRMPTLEFKGKPFVYSHHLSVPFRELIVDKKKSFPGGNKASLDDNLIIHGDNLEALKALLPRYAGKVDVIYIDPPYNTGNEGWAYNDAVNSPLMKEWLGKVVDREDLERHDKWLCMMWPRLQLLKELLADTGVLFVSIDYNEQPKLCAILDEIFGELNLIAHSVWHSKYTRANDAEFFSRNHEYIICYANTKDHARIIGERKDEGQYSAYRNPDSDKRGAWKATPLHAKSGTNDSKYLFPNKVEWKPPKGTFRRYGDDEMARLYADKRIWFGKDGDAIPQRKTFVNEIESRMPPTTHLSFKDVGSTHD